MADDEQWERLDSWVLDEYGRLRPAKYDENGDPGFRRTDFPYEPRRDDLNTRELYQYQSDMILELCKHIASEMNAQRARAMGERVGLDA